jgi:ribose transport system substrate-binding protein
MKSLRPISKKIGTTLVAGISVLALAACTSNDPDEDDEDLGGGTSQADSGSNDEAGDTVVIGFSAPAADHGWMG